MSHARAQSQSQNDNILKSFAANLSVSQYPHLQTADDKSLKLRQNKTARFVNPLNQSEQITPSKKGFQNLAI